MEKDSAKQVNMFVETEKIAEDIIRQLCKKAIDSMNSDYEKSGLSVFPEDYPDDFSFFDKLSIEMETKSYDEINPGLEDYVKGHLDAEYALLSPNERSIVEQSNMDWYPWVKVVEIFGKMRWENLETDKIQEFIENKPY